MWGRPQKPPAVAWVAEAGVALRQVGPRALRNPAQQQRSEHSICQTRCPGPRHPAPVTVPKTKCPSAVVKLTANSFLLFFPLAICHLSPPFWSGAFLVSRPNRPLTSRCTLPRQGTHVPANQQAHHPHPARRNRFHIATNGRGSTAGTVGPATERGPCPDSRPARGGLM